MTVHMSYWGHDLSADSNSVTYVTAVIDQMKRIKILLFPV